MKLPDLPKQKKDQEAKFAVKFRGWIEKNPRMSCTFEMKDTRGKSSLPFSEVTQEQCAYGMKVKGKKGVLLRVQGWNGEPDYSYHRADPAYVVIKFNKSWAIIDIETFIMEDKRSPRRSLTEGRAREIAVKVIHR